MEESTQEVETRLAEQQKQQNEATIKALSSVVKPVRQLYKCEVCGKTWMKWFFVTRLFKGFPRVRFCGKECRGNRHGKFHNV